MSAAGQGQFDQLLHQHPGLSTFGLPDVPKLQRLSLQEYWPFQAVLCPYLELRELEISVKHQDVDLGSLHHLHHLTTLRVAGTELGSTLSGLQGLQSLRCEHAACSSPAHDVFGLLGGLPGQVLDAFLYGARVRGGREPEQEAN